MRTNSLRLFVVGVALGFIGCSGTDTNSTPSVGGGSSAVPTGGSGPASTGGTSSVTTATNTGGSTTVVGTGGATTGGATSVTSPTGGAATGGKPATGGTTSVVPPTGGAATGGKPATGGTTSVVPPTGGTAAGGTATGGAATGGKSSTGGSTALATGGTTAGGKSSTGGTTSATTTGGAGTAGGSAVNCSATMPTGGTAHCNTANASGNAGGLNWSLWMNSSGDAGSCITTYNTSAFSAQWDKNADFLARIGLEWGSGGKTYDQYGSIVAQYAQTKTGTGGGYSYIGIYGWSNNPCVEYYIIDDSYGTMPFTPYQMTAKGTATTIDGTLYKFYSGNTTGSGGSRCPAGTSSWAQYWSVAQTRRQCGTITISEHFAAWKAAGMNLGNLLEAKILVEVGGGTGSITFPVASVTAK